MARKLAKMSNSRKRNGKYFHRLTKVFDTVKEGVQKGFGLFKRMFSWKERKEELMRKDAEDLVIDDVEEELGVQSVEEEKKHSAVDSKKSKDKAKQEKNQMVLKPDSTFNLFESKKPAIKKKDGKGERKALSNNYFKPGLNLFNNNLNRPVFVGNQQLDPVKARSFGFGEKFPTVSDSKYFGKRLWNIRLFLSKLFKGRKITPVDLINLNGEIDLVLLILNDKFKDTFTFEFNLSGHSYKQYKDNKLVAWANKISTEKLSYKDDSVFILRVFKLALKYMDNSVFSDNNHHSFFRKYLFTDDDIAVLKPYINPLFVLLHMKTRSELTNKRYLDLVFENKKFKEEFNMFLTKELVNKYQSDISTYLSEYFDQLINIVLKDNKLGERKNYHLLFKKFKQTCTVPCPLTVVELRDIIERILQYQKPS